MARQVIGIIQEACGQLGQISPTVSAFNNALVNNTDQDAMIMFSKFRYWYRDLVNKQPEDFKKEVDIVTNASQKVYAFPDSLQGLDIADIQNVRYIGDEPFNAWWLNYYTEREMERMFPNIEDIPEGQVTGWFLNTNNSSNNKELRFYLTPNDSYRIRFYLNEIPSNLNASDNTGCNRYGDEYLITRMVEELSKHWFGEESMKYQESKRETQKKWIQYRMKKWNNAKYSTYIPPNLSSNGLYTDINPRY